MTSATSAARVRTVPVQFSGERAGVFPATFSQSSVLNWITWEGSGATFALHADLPAGCTVTMVADAVGMLLTRHEVLRTTFGDGPDGRLQIVAKQGTTSIGVVELGAAARSTVRLSPSARPFEHRTAYPMRVVVATDDGTPVRVLFEFSHVGLDAIAATIVRRELVAIVQTLVAGTGQPEAHRIPSPGWQPVDQAAFEHSPDGAAARARTLRYWQDRLQRVPLCLLGRPAHQTIADYRTASLRSSTGATAVSQLAERVRVSPATVIMSTVTALLAWWTDNDQVAVYAAYSNRAQPKMHAYVGTISQEALLPYAPASSSLYATLRQMHVTAMNGYRHASFDDAATARVVESVALARGRWRHRDLVVNDVSAISRGLPGEIGDGDGRMRRSPEVHIETGRPTATSDPIRLIIRRIAPVLVLDVTHDRRYVSDREAADLLAAVHRLMVRAADNDLDLADLGPVAGIARVTRPDSWVKLPSGWADLAASQRLLREVAQDEQARLVIDHRSGNGPVVIGHVAPADPRCGSAELRAEAMTRLGDAHDMVLPDSYVLAPAHRDGRVGNGRSA